MLSLSQTFAHGSPMSSSTQPRASTRSSLATSVIGKRSAQSPPSRAKHSPTSSAFPSWKSARNQTSTSRRPSSASQATSRSASSILSSHSSNNSRLSTLMARSQLVAWARTAVKREYRDTASTIQPVELYQIVQAARLQAMPRTTMPRNVSGTYHRPSIHF